MQWTITDEDITRTDATGVEGLIQRMDQALRGDGTPIEGFRFLNSSREMYRCSQEIEKELLARQGKGSLYTGFQVPEKLMAESAKYLDLIRSGTGVTAFGQGAMPETTGPLQDIWVPLAPDTRALENQWFLVSPAPSPIAFIGWETSPENLFGKGRLTSPGKQFKGFITNDERVLKSVIAHLESVRAKVASLNIQEPGSTPEPRNETKRIMAVARMDDAPEYAAVRFKASNMAADNQGGVVLFEITAASYLVSPYPEEDRRQWIRTLREPELRRLGRSPLAAQLCAIRSKGADAEAILPTKHGFKHMADWAQREDIDMIILPASLVSPGLFDRLRGYSLRALLDHTPLPVMVVEPDGSSWQAQARNPQPMEACLLPQAVLR